MGLLAGSFGRTEQATLDLGVVSSNPPWGGRDYLNK